jgi:phenylalanyl-tRNA synthetase alpha chain
MSTEESIARLEEIRRKALASIEAVASSSELREIEIAHLGRRSELSRLRGALGPLPDTERREVGRVINEVQAAVEDALAARRAVVEETERDRRLHEERLDVTLPGRRPARGGIHPITQMLDEIVDVFVGLGFSVAEGPEVETDYYNFEALNIPQDHPARSMWDTLYLEPNEFGQPLLRTHTSPVQARVMESQPPPVYVVVPGRCARRETADPKHIPVFHQVEGLAVDEGISFADLKGTLEAFAKAMFGPEQRIRLNPSYFPFTEPSAEVALLCFVCGGVGCPTCRGEGWIEILGAGMVHPNVFRAVGYDPQITGFAFGLGVERVAMLRYGIPDIRWLYENDLRFLMAF